MDCAAFKSRQNYLRKMERLQRIWSARAGFATAGMAAAVINLLVFAFHWAGIDRLDKPWAEVRAIGFVTFPVATLGLLGYLYLGSCGRALREEIVKDAESEKNDEYHRG